MNADEIARQNLNDQIMEKVWDTLGKTRLYASLWDWPNKETKECGIVCGLLKSIEANGEHHGIVKIRPNKPDPPDCVGTTADGKAIAFEVTELVDQEAVKQNELVAQKYVKQNKNDKWTANEVFEKFRTLKDNRKYFVFKEWTTDELLEKVRNILKAKDAKNFHGCPYAKVVLVIHTDEPSLGMINCEEVLRGQSFGQFKQITDAYLLLPYDPRTQSHPFLSLELADLFPQPPAANLPT